VTARKKRAWWANNSVALLALGVSAGGWVTGWSSEHRLQSIEHARVAAAATALMSATDELVRDADGAKSAFAAAEDSLTSHQPWSDDFRELLDISTLPAFAPTAEQIEALSHSGDSTASHVQSCAHLRNVAEEKIEVLARGHNRLFDPVEVAYVVEVNWDLSSVTKACRDASVALERYAAPDPAPELATSEGTIRRYPGDEFARPIGPPPGLTEPSPTTAALGHPHR